MSEENGAETLFERVEAAMEIGQMLRFLDADKKLVEVKPTPALLQILSELLLQSECGPKVKVLPQDIDISVQQAASVLSVSKLFLESLLEKEELPFKLEGRRRRIKVQDVLVYKNQRDKERAEALGELAVLDAEHI